MIKAIIVFICLQAAGQGVFDSNMCKCYRAKDAHTHENIALSKLECENWKVSSEQTIKMTDP